MMEQNGGGREEYVINRFTMAIFPVEGQKNQSRIYEFEGNVHVKRRPLEVINASCSYFGSSYLGRKEGTKQLMGVTHKPPVVIDPANSIYFFPTTSSTRPQCSWISHSHVKSYMEDENESTRVTFTNGEETTLDMSIGSFENQLYRTAQLRTIMSSRIENEQRKMNMFLLPNTDSEKLSMYEQIIRELDRRMKKKKLEN